MGPSDAAADAPHLPSQQAPRERVEHEIELLLEEYRTLREENAQRVAARMQMIGFAGIISALLAASDRFTFRGPSTYVAVLVLLLGALWSHGVNRAIQRIGRHLRTVESRINTLSAQGWGSSQDILTWETGVQSRRRQTSRLLRWVGLLGGWYKP